MGATTLADDAYLKRRRGKRRSGDRWYVRVPVPKELHGILGKHAIERALGTSDRAAARRLKHAVIANIFEGFERARRGALTSGDIEHEAHLFLQDQFNVLKSRSETICTPDEGARGDAVLPTAELALFELYEMQENGEWPPVVEQAADRIATKYGVKLGPTQREELCQALHHAEIEAHTRVLGAYRGELLEPVSVLNARAIDPITAKVARPSRPSPKKSDALRVSEAAAAYVADSNREKQSSWTEQTRNQAETTLRLFADATKDAQIDTISRRHVADFLDKIASLDKNYGRHAMEKLSLDVLLQRYPAKSDGLSNRTLNRHCSVLAGMFEWAIKAGRLEGTNPAKGHHRKIASDHQTSEGRRAFTTAELNSLLGGPIFSVSRQDRVNPPRHTPNATLAWLIPIALFSGMRLDEICGLRTEDVAEEAGILFFNVVSHEGRHLKTAAARRRIPVHTELLHIGFGDYLANIRHQRHIYLFPGLKPARLDGKRSAYIGKRFVEYRRSVGVSDPNTTFHCMRKNAATALQRARIAESEAAEVLGHKKMTMTYGLYSEGLELKGHREVVEAISYPGLNLSRLLAE